MKLLPKAYLLDKIKVLKYYHFITGHKNYNITCKIMKKLKKNN